MALTKPQSESITKIITESLRKKLRAHNPEPAAMPFHTSLLGKDRLALYSFIHSLNTNFGTAIFEPVALELAKGRFASAKAQVKTGQMISAAAQDEIQKIINKLRAGDAEPDKPAEIAAIRKVCQKGEMRSVKSTKVDLRLEKTAKSICSI